ncbi:MOSC domain-containing protein [Candidatus Woesearchaeota archaeon]|nr:MOSC domain-containing protein [Candidatus Woesearchaeota archaeon]
MQGIIYQLNVKPETPGQRGLPKHSVNHAAITLNGVIGDYNKYRTTKKNNTPDRALLIMPWEMLQQLNAEGWPVHAGHLGENITTRGIPYEHFAAGQRYKSGSVEFIITEPCNPCVNLQVLPYVGERVQEFIKTLVGRRGWYARAAQAGVMRSGDAIEEMVGSTSISAAQMAD